MSVTSLDHALDGGELVERIVELDLGDGGAGDRRQQRATQRIAQCVPEARLERADGETLTIALWLAQDVDCRSVHDQGVGNGHIDPFVGDYLL